MAPNYSTTFSSFVACKKKHHVHQTCPLVQVVSIGTRSRNRTQQLRRSSWGFGLGHAHTRRFRSMFVRNKLTTTECPSVSSTAAPVSCATSIPTTPIPAPSSTTRACVSPARALSSIWRCREKVNRTLILTDDDKFHIQPIPQKIQDKKPLQSTTCRCNKRY